MPLAAAGLLLPPLAVGVLSGVGDVTLAAPATTFGAAVLSAGGILLRSNVTALVLVPRARRAGAHDPLQLRAGHRYTPRRV